MSAIVALTAIAAMAAICDGCHSCDSCGRWSPAFREIATKKIGHDEQTGVGKKTLNDYINLLPKKSVFVFGNEAHGLPKEIITKCDEQVRIPMKAGAESLNLATSAALVIYAASNSQTPIE